MSDSDEDKRPMSQDERLTAIQYLLTRRSRWEQSPSQMEERQRRSFTDDYKRQAVDLVASSGRSIGSVAKELGLRDSVLRRWVELRGEPSADHAAEIARLQRENERLRMERDIGELIATRPSVTK